MRAVVALSSGKSINSTSQNSSTSPPALVTEQPFAGLSDYVVVASNDLGMHCANLDQRVISILPPFNTLHAQVLHKGAQPQILDNTQVQVLYSAASNPQDPALSGQLPSLVFKSNFWDINPRTGNTYAFDALNPYYPPGVLALFPMQPDFGLPVPDLQRLYLGDGKLAADQQSMPSLTGPLITQPYTANEPQAFKLYYSAFPFFISFPFGYTLPNIDSFSAEGIPMAPFDDLGRPNSYPLMRIQAAAAPGNSLGVSNGTVLASLDTVVPISGEVSCQTCHATKSDGGNGLATDGKGFVVATRFDDPQYGKVPSAVSIAYAFGLNILRLHDVRTGTNLVNATPVACQSCHYSPALDLAHVGPKGPGDADANGREQTLHHSFSAAMHEFHGNLRLKRNVLLFPKMPSPRGRSLAMRDSKLLQSCYLCHPGATTKCFRGAMFNAGQACQDCHGQMSQVGNDFSKNVSPKNPGAFLLSGDFYTNPKTLRVPWANEPMCQSCHTGDVNSNLAASIGVIRAPDRIHLLQAFRTRDALAKPIVATNRRYAENQSGSKQVLYRLSVGHGGVLCEGCHGATHAEWPNATASANDNIAATQLQGHPGTIVECETCHTPGSLTINEFINNFDANGLMKGPHGMHPVDASWVEGHHDVFDNGSTPRGLCQACHGAKLQGSVLATVATDRTLPCGDGGNARPFAISAAAGCSGGQITLTKGTQVSCTLCHGNPGISG